MAARKKAVSHGDAEVAAKVKVKVKRKAPAKKKPVKKPSRQEVAAAFLRPLTPSPVLAKVVGKRPRSRVGFVQALWDYVKKHRLNTGPSIRADDRLRALFGGREVVSMFELTKYLNANLS